MEPLEIQVDPPIKDRKHNGVVEGKKKGHLWYDADSNESETSVRIDDTAVRLAGSANDTTQEVTSDTPTINMYLTFETPLPVPNYHVDGASDLPPCPDLARYTNPLKWPRLRKGVMVALSCIATCATAYTAGSYTPPTDLIAAELGTTRVGALAGLTTFCMGFALAPMVLAPFSEINGRYPVFAVAGVFFTVFQAVCGAVHNLTGMLVARFLTGVGGSVFSTMVGGVIADMYEKEDRNTPMALFSGSVLVGTGLGPLCASVMVQRWGDADETWKWIFWHQAIFDFALMIAIAVLFKESRGCVLLSRRARALNSWYDELEAKGIYGVWVRDGQSNGGMGVLGNIDEEKGTRNSPTRLRRVRWITKEEEQRGSLVSMMSASLLRPFHLLFTEPILFFFSLWVAFAWAVLYLTFGSVPLVFARQYDFTIQQGGYVFTAMITGSIVATTLGIYQEELLKHPSWQHKVDGGSENDSFDSTCARNGRVWTFVRRYFPAESHESRLYFTCFTSVLLPIGLYMFGFSAQPSTHWFVPALAVGFASMGIFYIYLAVFNYLADIYQSYASSALAAQSFCRNVLGGVFPLVSGALFTNLGEDAAGGLLGAIATALTVVPWALVFFGERIRARSKFAVVSTSDLFLYPCIKWSACFLQSYCIGF